MSRLNWAEWPVGRRRSALWLALLALVGALLAMQVWLAGRYETSQVQTRLERDAAEILTDIRTGLTRNLQSLQALQSFEASPEGWHQRAAELLKQRREIVHVEWRSPGLDVLSHVESTYRGPVFERLRRGSTQTDLGLACTTARRINGAAYSSSFFMPQPDGLGFEILDICVPVVSGDLLMGYVVATYALQDILSELVGTHLTRGQSMSFTEADGTRLALYGRPSEGNRVYVAQQLLDLPGNTMVLRLETRKGLPDLFPNVLTALVTAMALALIAVLYLLSRDMRRRLKVEHDLGEALAFRKAMEDSVLTGLRARDLKGRITYVNPAFCQMVGVEAKDLLHQSFPSPYWPPELAPLYQARQAIRLAGNTMPREGFESVFMRPDGTRFPVLIMEAPLINAVGKHTGWMSAILDVSEQRRVEELSRASQERLQATARLAMVGEMASLLSHELNQPLAAISSYATGSLNMLRQAGDDADPAKQAASAPPAPPLASDLQLAMSRIAEQAERAGKVIKSVHDFVRRRDQEREAVNPQALLDAVMPLVALQAQKLVVQVKVDVDPGCEAVFCDRTMVEQVLLNLSRNGMQAMRNLQGPHAARVLTLQVRPAASNARSSWVEFLVSDAGEGISDEVAAQLFTPFFTTRAEGMGLGLSLCRTVIEQHGGHLDFQARQPQGTTFSFTLPVAVFPAAAGSGQGLQPVWGTGSTAAPYASHQASPASSPAQA